MNRVLLITIIAVALGGCATVTRGTKDVFEVNTNPPGAQVATSNGFQCSSTPCGIQMPRRSQFVARIEKEGCQPVEVTVSNRVSGGGGAALAGNVFVGGVIGLGVDAATGASQELIPNPVNVQLECK